MPAGVCQNGRIENIEETRGRDEVREGERVEAGICSSFFFDNIIFGLLVLP